MTNAGGNLFYLWDSGLASSSESRVTTVLLVIFVESLLPASEYFVNGVGKLHCIDTTEQNLQEEDHA